MRLFKRLSQLWVTIAVGLMGVLVWRLNKLDILPGKYFWLLVAGVGVVAIVMLFVNFWQKTKMKLRFLLTLVATALFVVGLLGISKINTMDDFLDQNFGVVEPEDGTAVEVNIDINVTVEPFTIYVSGVDTRAEDLRERALSDVNIVLTVNPQTHQVAMTFIPRDYYVYLHGVGTDLRDKLTHAGTVGGVALSKATVEDVLGVKIDHYIKVNFSFVRKLVDMVGGITLVSDTDFTAWTDKSCHFTVGKNTVDGKCALAFARERMSYQSGDNHRGENQEQVIARLVEKLSQSDLLKHYDELLAALDGTFETSLSRGDITNLVKMQLADNPAWTAEAVNLRGSGSMQSTYSYPGQALYVSFPDEASVATAKAKIEAVLEAK